MQRRIKIARSCIDKLENDILFYSCQEGKLQEQKAEKKLELYNQIKDRKKEEESYQSKKQDQERIRDQVQGYLRSKEGLMEAINNIIAYKIVDVCQYKGLMNVFTENYEKYNKYKKLSSCNDQGIKK